MVNIRDRPRRYVHTKPARKAKAAAAVRDASPSLLKMLARWRADGVFAEHELAGDLLVGLARRDQLQYLNLTLTEPRALGRTRRHLAMLIRLLSKGGAVAQARGRTSPSAWLAVDCRQPLAVVNVCRQSTAVRLTDGWTKPR